MLSSEQKQRARYIDQLNNYLATLGFEETFLPEPMSAIHIAFLPEDFKVPAMFDTWLGKLNITYANQQQTSLALMIQITDWNFLSLPEVYVKGPLTPELESLIGLAHFTPMPFYIPILSFEAYSDYYLKICYSLHNEISLPRHEPEKIVNWILQQCHKLFNESLVDIATRDADIRRDLDTMWEQLSLILQCSEVNFVHHRIKDIQAIIQNYNQSSTSNNMSISRPDNLHDQQLLQRWHSFLLSEQEYYHRIEPTQFKVSLSHAWIPWKSSLKQTYQNTYTIFIVINSPKPTVPLPSLAIFSKRIFEYLEKLHRERKDTHAHGEPLLRLGDLILWLKLWQKQTLKIWKDLFFNL